MWPHEIHPAKVYRVASVPWEFQACVSGGASGDEDGERNLVRTDL